MRGKIRWCTPLGGFTHITRVALRMRLTSGLEKPGSAYNADGLVPRLLPNCRGDVVDAPLLASNAQVTNLGKRCLSADMCDFQVSAPDLRASQRLKSAEDV